MWLSKLPDPRRAIQSDKAPVYDDHILFEERLNGQYSYPGHKVSFGIISLFEGQGLFNLNECQEQLDAAHFLISNENSILSIDIKTTRANPALLFFRTDLPRMIGASLEKNPEWLLDNPEGYAQQDFFGILERLHPMNPGLRQRMGLLPGLGSSSSSFAALKADLVIRSIAEELVREGLRAHKASFNIPVRKKSTRTELCKRLYLAREWMEANYQQPITIQAMAGIACMNSQHFLRCFKQLFLKTPYQCLIDIRLEKAKNLLVNGHESVQSICQLSGLESLSSFSWMFKKRFGMSPTRFRVSGSL